MKIKRTVRLFALCLAILLAIPALYACSEPLEEGQLEVKWNLGMITSDLHKESPCTILEGEEGYSYSDVITIPNAGTRITFVDDNGPDAEDSNYASEKVFVISHWIEEDGNWVMDHPGDNYTGMEGRSGEIAKIIRNESATYTYITSYRNEHIRLCYRSGQTEEHSPRKFPFAKVFAESTLEQGTFASAPESVHKDLAVAKFLKTAKDECWFDILQGRTMYAMGDSYFGGSSNGKQYVWPNLLAKKYGMEFSNWGIGGSSVAVGGYVPMCDRISTMTDGAPDIVLLEGGRNDFSNENIAVGTVQDTANTTFCGGVSSCIQQLKEKYPNALIIGITCWKVTQTNKAGETQQQYADAMKAVCEKYGIPCFDASDETLTGVHMDEYSFRVKYCQTDYDISHLNTEGMILVEPAFERFIAQQYAAFLEAKGK